MSRSPPSRALRLLFAWTPPSSKLLRHKTKRHKFTGFNHRPSRPPPFSFPALVSRSPTTLINTKAATTQLYAPFYYAAYVHSPSLAPPRSLLEVTHMYLTRPPARRGGRLGSIIFESRSYLFPFIFALFLTLSSLSGRYFQLFLDSALFLGFIIVLSVQSTADQITIVTTGTNLVISLFGYTHAIYSPILTLATPPPPPVSNVKTWVISMNTEEDLHLCRQAGRVSSTGCGPA